MNGETVDDASWLIGERFVIDVNNVPYALRSLADPGTAYIDNPYIGTDDQPQDMSHYYSCSEDNGGVHINSGIPNHAFNLFLPNQWSFLGHSVQNLVQNYDYLWSSIVFRNFY